MRLFFLLILTIQSCSTIKMNYQDRKQKIAKDSELFLIDHSSTIHVTDPDPTGTYLEKYLTEFKQIAFKQHQNHEIQSHCDFHESLKNYQCYLEQKIGLDYFRSFHFIINEEKEISSLDSVAICKEKTPQIVYESPECPINLEN